MKKLIVAGLIVFLIGLAFVSRAALSPGEKIELIEEKFLKGEVSERTYLELREKYRRQVEGEPFPSPIEAEIQLPQRDRATVSLVVDGDTVRLEDGERVRYLGIDTPESRKKTEDGEWNKLTNPYANRATELNRSLVEGNNVELEYDVTSRDRYGRKLCYIFIDGVFVNGELVRQGLAMPMSCPPDVKYDVLIRKCMEEARREKRGLWKELLEQPISSDDADKHIGQVQTVVGKVRNIFPGEKCISLNFGDDYKTDFTIAIFPNQLDNFRQCEIDPTQYYLGKTVKVCGLIKEYNGPEIVIERPEQIEIVEEEEPRPQPEVMATPSAI